MTMQNKTGAAARERRVASDGRRRSAGWAAGFTGVAGLGLAAAGALFIAGTVFVAVPSGCDRAAGAPGEKADYRHPRVCILGCDGMDPQLVRRMMDEGRLPNLSKLADEGAFVPLETSIPPQSPVAWSNFITGAGPGVHGIFDFIHRDPTQQCAPYFSTNRIVESHEDGPISVGSYEIAKSSVLPWVDGATNELLRRGTPFWDYLDEAGIPVQMYKLPANYPPSKSDHGHMCCLAGMGVPDAFGNQGTCQQFSSKPRRESRGTEGYKLRLRPIYRERGVFVGDLYGPTNEYRPIDPKTHEQPQMQKPLRVYPDPRNPVAKIVFENEGMLGSETVELILSVGEWSPWTEVHWHKTPIGPTSRTMARFFLQRVNPDVELYVTPLNFVPEEPETTISEPPEFASEIAEAIGPYHTQGFAEAFNARKLKLLSDEEYRIQAEEILKESERMMDYALDRFEDGVLFFYYSSTDLQAHIFWWDSDEKHPCRTPEEAARYNGVIESIYERMDQALGRCREKLGDDVTYVVMSDHGFCNFKRCVGLCTWLKNEGYLVADHGVLSDADWSKTRAYGLGLNGLYVNLKGRERDGSVDPQDRGPLLDEITKKLLALRDPDTGEKVIRRVYRAEECYRGPEVANAPDLIIGYERGYRASWNTGLGDLDKAVVFDNDNAWSADHCIAHDVVPGILFCNRKPRIDAPALIDMAPTILGIFGIDTPPQMTGRNLFAPAPAAAQMAARTSP